MRSRARGVVGGGGEERSGNDGWGSAWRPLSRLAAIILIMRSPFVVVWRAITSPIPAPDG
eukprot:4714889-Pyramimonas_sp.AAC.1